MRGLSRPPQVRPDPRRGEVGVTTIEIVLTVVLTAVVVGSLSSLLGAAVRSKLISSVRSAESESARQTLEWMSERLRNAGLNVNPNAPSQSSWPLRCKDMVVAQDAALQPTASRVYVSGEILNIDTTAGNEVITLGYVLQSGVVMESKQNCSSSAPPATLSPLSDAKIPVTGLAFAYFGANGVRITSLTDATQIRRIRLIRITLTVQGSEGTSGLQTLTVARDVMLRNPEPYANNYMNLTEYLP